MLIEHVFAKCPVEELHEGILIGFNRLGMLSQHIMVCALLFKCLTEKRGTIVRPNEFRQAMVALDLIK